MKHLIQVRQVAPLAIAAMLACGQGCPSGSNPNPNPGNGGNNGGNNNGGQVEDKGLPGETSRVAFQSQCAQNVIVCTVTFPKARVRVLAGPGQTVTPTTRGFIVQGSDGNESEIVNFSSEGSTAGQTATQLYYSWTHAAGDGDPLTLTPGPQFSNQPNPSVKLAAGLHYVRLTLQNDIFRDEILSPGGDVILRNVFQSDFVEIEVDVRD